MSPQPEDRPAWCPDSDGCMPLAGLKLTGRMPWGWCMGRLYRPREHYPDERPVNPYSWCVRSDVGHGEPSRIICNRDDVVSWIITQAKALRDNGEPLPEWIKLIVHR